jgi:hypothetical protein
MAVQRAAQSADKTVYSMADYLAGKMADDLDDPMGVLRAAQSADKMVYQMAL